MATPGHLLLFLPLVIAFAVLALAIYEHVTASALSLPFAPTLSAVVVALPVIALANAGCLAFGRQQPRLGRRASLIWTHRQYTHFRVPSLASVLQVLQGIVTVVVASLLIVNNIAGGGSSWATSSPILRCALDSTWQRLFTSRNGEALRRIQDALNCCGFNSVVDRSWPFPGGGSGSTCAASYGRTTPCRELWMHTVHRRAGIELAVVILAALFQAVTLVGRGRGGSWGTFSLGAQNQASSEQQQQGIRQPLLADRPAIEYVQPAAVDESDSEAEEDGADQASPNGQNTVQDSQNGPRLEPSSLRNEWATE